ncbi:MAG TPA: alpha/beta fold hydrolase [Myxococcota bacterium]|nr:alpha/beta fold hydrolase [Myxococcota bacterium]
MPHAVVQGRKLYYELHGHHPAPPFLLAIGIGGSCRGWLPLQVPEFSRERATLIFDYPGVGGSEPREGAFSTADLADTAVALLDALGIGRADVGGAFMGGMLAQELALRHPQRVERLVLMGSFARADAKRRLLLAQWRELARSDAPLSTMIRDRLLWTAHDDTIAQTDLIEQMVEFFTRDGAPLSADLFARQCDACLGHDTLSRLPEILQPTLVIGGAEDLLTPPKLQRELAAGIRHSRLVVVPGAAHLAMVEAAEVWNRTVLQFLGEGRER